MVILFAFAFTSFTYGQDDSMNYTITITDSVNKPDSTKFVKPVPNPFAPSSSFKISVNEKEIVMVKVYDKNDNLLFNLFNKEFNPGIYRIEYDPSKLESGVYIFKLVTANTTDFQNVYILK